MHVFIRSCTDWLIFNPMLAFWEAEEGFSLNLCEVSTGATACICAVNIPYSSECRLGEGRRPICIGQALAQQTSEQAAWSTINHPPIQREVSLTVSTATCHHNWACKHGEEGLVLKSMKGEERKSKKGEQEGGDETQ